MFHGGVEDRNSKYVKLADELIKALQASKGHLPTAEQIKTVETAMDKLTKEVIVPEKKLHTAQEERVKEKEAYTSKKGSFGGP